VGSEWVPMAGQGSTMDLAALLATSEARAALWDKVRAAMLSGQALGYADRLAFAMLMDLMEGDPKLAAEVGRRHGSRVKETRRRVGDAITVAEAAARPPRTDTSAAKAATRARGRLGRNKPPGRPRKPDKK